MATATAPMTVAAILENAALQVKNFAYNSDSSNYEDRVELVEKIKEAIHQIEMNIDGDHPAAQVAEGLYEHLNEILEDAERQVENFEPETGRGWGRAIELGVD